MVRIENTTLRKRYNEYNDRLGLLHTEIKSLYTRLSNIADSTSEEYQLLQRNIGAAKSEQRKLRKSCNEIIDILFDVLEQSDVDFKEKEQDAIAYLEAIEKRATTDELLQQERIQRNIDNKARQDCMAATLKEVWTTATFPIFNTICNLDDDDPDSVMKAKYYASLAIYQHTCLRLQLDQSLDSVQPPIEPVWLMNGAPEITIDSVRKQLDKINSKVAKRYDAYEQLTTLVTDKLRR